MKKIWTYMCHGMEERKTMSVQSITNKLGQSNDLMFVNNF
jgi:hypothetical protein